MTEREDLQSRLAKAQEQFRTASTAQQAAQIEIDDLSREIAGPDERERANQTTEVPSNVSADSAGSINPKP